MIDGVEVCGRALERICDACGKMAPSSKTEETSLCVGSFYCFVHVSIYVTHGVSSVDLFAF